MVGDDEGVRGGDGGGGTGVETRAEVVGQLGLVAGRLCQGGREGGADRSEHVDLTADRGQIRGAILDGPLAFDNAISMEAVRIKGIASDVAGQADILAVPNLESGNMVAKQLEYMAGASGSGLVLGARVPIALTSRADGPAARVASTVLAVLAAHDQRRKRAANAWKQG